MKIINFGSLNIDKVYQTDSFVKPGETIFAKEMNIFPGGKGLNQSIAAARAGANVIHAGMIGKDGIFLLELLKEAGAKADNVLVSDENSSGHAIIEVNNEGQNRIIVHGGTNQLLPSEYIDSIISLGEEEDIVLLQNETNLIGEIIDKSANKGLKVAFNPSPLPSNLEILPLDKVSYFLVNEHEASALANMSCDEGFEIILDRLSYMYPNAAIIMTLGSEGVLYSYKGVTESHPIFKVKAVDTTAAGDTFAGYFLSAILHNRNIRTALREASAASAIAVSRNGAVPSIPKYEDVVEFLKNN